MLYQLSYEATRLERGQFVELGFFFPVALIGNLTAMIILHFHLQLKFKYELFHIHFNQSINQSMINKLYLSSNFQSST